MYFGETEFAQNRINPEENGRIEQLKTLSDYETWFGLIDPDGKPLGIPILKRIIQNPDITRIVVIGPPGAGKTIIVKQLSSLLNELYIDTSTVFFDDILGKIENMTKRHRSTWRGDEWDSLSDMILEVVKEPKEEENEKRSIQVVELPAVGDKETFNLGISTLGT